MLPTSSGAGISTAAAIATVRAIFIIGSSFYRQTTGANGKMFRAPSTITSRNVGSEDRLHSSRARITVAGNCFGPIISLLKFSEKIVEPGGHGLLNGVLCTEPLPDRVLNIARQSDSPDRSLFAWHRS